MPQAVAFAFNVAPGSSARHPRVSGGPPRLAVITSAEAGSPICAAVARLGVGSARDLLFVFS
jgi:hypothetical protein